MPASPPTPSYETRVVGARVEILRDFYHFALRLRWGSTVALIAGTFVGLNALFALVYLAVGGVENARPGSFLDMFFFSVQTMATIGYGMLYPTTTLTNSLVVLEALVGLLLTALATGLVFAKFSLPVGRIAFASRATISPHDGVPTLQIRVGNERANLIAEATVRVVLVRTVTTREGTRFYRMTDLPLVRERSPAMTRSWTVMHLIDATSPLSGATPASLVAEEVELLVSVVGTDDVSYQPVHARWRYEADQVAWGARHADVLSETPDGHLLVDVRRFDELVPTEAIEGFPYPAGPRLSD